MAGSRAVSARESGQIREEAALSEVGHAPRTSLAGAEDRRARPKASIDDGCTVHFHMEDDQQRNLHVVKQLGELWNARDFEAMLAFYDEDVEVVTDPGWPEPPTTGRDAFARASAEWRDAWEKSDIDVGRSQAVGPDRVLAEGAWDSRGATSGIGGAIPFGILFTLRGGIIVRMQWFMDPLEARRAAGLG
jgi:ketosteroid isomerase-like protein